MKSCIKYIFLAMAFILCGCRSTQYVDREVTKYVNHTDTLHQRDSIWCHDSVSVYMRGDTVFRDRWRTCNMYHNIYKSKTDTIFRDSVQTKTEVKEVAQHLTWWQNTQMIIGDAALLLLLVMLLVKFTKKAGV